MTEHKVEADYDPRTFAFANPLAPRFGFASVDLYRSQVTFERGGDTKRTEGTAWRMTVNRVKSDRAPILLIGDLTVRESGWFVGCTVVAQIVFAEGHGFDLDSDQGFREVGDAIATWASIPLYDVAACWARGQVAMSQTCDVAVPIVTPRPTITLDNHLLAEDVEGKEKRSVSETA